MVARLPAATFDWLLDTSIPFNRYLLHQLNERVAQFIGKAEYDRLLDRTRAWRAWPSCSTRCCIRAWACGWPSPRKRSATWRACRASANQALRKLEEAGLLTVEYGAVRVLDLDGLKQYGSDREAVEGETA